MKRLLTFDASYSRRVTISSGSNWWRWAKIFAHLGDGPYVFITLGLIYLAGWVGTNALLRRGALIMIIVVFLTMATVTAIKFIVRRQRPQPPGEFVTFHYDMYSFPSGHAARMMSLTVSALIFLAPLGLLLMIFTLSVSAARIVVGIHYISDVLVGLGLGATIAWITTYLLLSII